MTTPFAVATALPVPLASADGKILGLISQGLFSGAVALVWAVLVVEVFGRVLVDLIVARRNNGAAAEQQQQRRLDRQARRQQPALFPGIDRARRRLNRLNARF
ncbi:hypothetical protein LQW54_007390 [Pestalotiopsis sp. IQ-011]